MARFDNLGMFWNDIPQGRSAADRVRVRPPVPETGWKAPREFPNLAGARVLSFDTETYDPELVASGPGWGRHKGHIVGFSIGAKDGAGNVGQWYFPIRHEDTPEDNLDAAQCLRWAKAQLETPHIPKVGANLTYDYGWMLEEGIRVQGPLFDVQFAEALLDERARVGLDVLASKYLGEHKQGSLLYRWCADFYGGNANDTQRKNIYRSPPSLVGPYGEADVALPLQIMEQQWPLLAKEGLLDLFHMECELIPLMVAMRRQGVPVDITRAEEMYEGFGKEVDILNARLRELVGFHVNINSADDLARAFTAHSIPFALTAKGKPSFTADFLEDIDHPVGQLVVDIRQREKLRSVFIKSYILNNHVNGIVHGTFNQLRGEGGGTRSGRFSCVDADTLIDTDSGPRAIKDIRVGDKVLTHKRRYRAVTHKWRKGVEQMFRVTFSDHNVIICTAAHRFLTTTGWRTLKDIMRASIQTNSGRSIQHRGKPAPVSRHVTGSDNATDWRYPWYKLQSRDGNSCGAYVTGRKTCTCEDTLFGVENSRQESDVRCSRRRTSQLDWLVRRWRRVSNLLAQRQTRSRAASCNGTGTWIGDITKAFRGSSYRLRQKEQRARQSSACDPIWSSDVTFPSARGRDQITIAQIEPCGNREVWDITVDEDSSYSACGVFSHNSDTPNLQNIPIRTEIGKRIRSIFADKYLSWRKYDYCVSPKTRVLTNDLQWIKAGDIQVGDNVIAYDEEPVYEKTTQKPRRYLRQSKIVAKKILWRPSFRIVTNNTSIDCAAEHRWLVRENNEGAAYRWVMTKNLKPVQRICRITDTWEDPVRDFDLGWLSGVYDGEGHISGAGSQGQGFVAVSQKPGPVLDKMKALLSKYGFAYTECPTDSAHTLRLTGARSASWKLMSWLRPIRLMPKFVAAIDGRAMQGRCAADKIISIEDIGVQPVIALETEHKTFIAEGLASHNSQIEYRCLAHFAVDKGDGSADRVREAYARDPNTDYHVQTQHMVRKIAGLEISRPHIKNMNFGLIYGMGEPKLARQLGVTAGKAKEMFTAYHTGAPYAKATMQQCIEEAQLYGTITTILGRKSRFDLWQPAAFGVDGVPTTYSNALMRYGNIKRAYTHKALNRRLQGSAADMMKKAMHQCYVSGVFDETGYPALTVHDELDFIDPGGKDEAFREMQRIMETCISLRVPVIADYEIGASWGTVDDPAKWQGTKGA